MSPIEQSPPCPHCIDGHSDPRTRPWSAFLSSERDSDGQPTHIIVGTSNGSHCSESDARWLRKLLREWRSASDLPGEHDQ